MAKFSVGGDERARPSSSSSRSKRRRFDSQTQSSVTLNSERNSVHVDVAVQDEEDDNEYGREGEEEEEEEEEEEDPSSDQEDEEMVSDEGEGDEEESEGGEDEEEEEESEDDQEQRGREQAIPALDRSITVTLDPDVLDCAICLEPLSAPVYQCENGHIACSSCCSKMSNKCPTCSWPIGYNRCRAIEKVLESARLACKFSKYGCKDSITYNKKQDHEKSCPHVPCTCPLPLCHFIGSSKQLSRHFTTEHPHSATTFRFNTTKFIHLALNSKYHVLQEEQGGNLFFLTNSLDPLGNKINISCIGPSLRGDHTYEITARHGQSCLKYSDVTKNIQEPFLEPQATPFLLIPKGFFSFLSASPMLKLEFVIRDHLSCSRV